MTTHYLPEPLEAVIFDMDGTLLDTERLHHQAMDEAARELGYIIDPALFAAMVGVHREINQALLVKELGPDFPVDAFYAEADARFAALAAGGVPVKPGVHQVLDRLAARGVRCAVATSTLSPAAEEHLARAGLLNRFETVVTRSCVERPKPAPDPYLLAAERLGVEPARCLAVEDSLNGLRSARGAGIATVVVPDLLRPNDEMERLAVAILPSLAELDHHLSGRAQRQRSLGEAIAVMVACVCLLGTLLFGALPAGAQVLPGTAPANSAAPAASDPYGRETPRGLADGLIRALASRDYPLASRYFDLSALPQGERATAGAAYAQRLQAALDGGGTLQSYIELSNDPAGRIDDQLPPDEERIGSLPGRDGSGTVPLIARAGSEQGARVWRISAASIAALPAAAAAEQDLLRSWLPSILTDTEVFGAPLSDWLILLVAAVLFYAASRLVFAVALAVTGRRYEDREASRLWRLLHAASAPLSLYLAVLLFLIFTRSLHVAIVARQLVSRFAGAAALIALAWFLWRLVDVVADIAAIRMDKGHRRRAKAIIVFARRAVKLLLIAFAAVAALGAVGIDVTTGIAALGLGGLALALGAQKTVENIVGSISVIADEPIRVGDFCRVGDVVGTVEDIGIRSTRIRTNARTRVTIPNGAFASLQIENFALRDRYLFSPKLSIARDLDADGLDRVIEAVRTALKEADYLFEGARVTFTGFSDNAFVLEVFGWIDVPDFEQSLYLQEKLYLSIMRRVEEAGGRFALPVTALTMDPPTFKAAAG